MEIDRLSIRERPSGQPIMYQTWGKLLFMHWPVDEVDLRPRIPEGLTIDTYEGSAWIGITPFTMWNIRPSYMPALPFVSSSHELNVRTYVHHQGVPGVWFFSLDASNPLAVLGARFAFALPYFQALMSLEEDDQTIHFSSQRRHPGAAPAAFKASWTRGGELAEARPGSLEFFLIERYCLYAYDRKRIYRARIHHRPWPLRRAELHDHSSTMISARGISQPPGEPLLHAQGAPLKVEVWPLERL